MADNNKALISLCSSQNYLVPAAQKDAELAKHLPKIVKEEVKGLKIKNLRLFGDRVLIKPEEAPETIKGMAVPSEYREKHKPSMGRIVGVGPKCTEAVSNEDVYYGKYAGTVVVLREGEQFNYQGKPIDLKIGGELLIMREADVFMAETDA